MYGARLFGGRTHTQTIALRIHPKIISNPTIIGAYNESIQMPLCRIGFRFSSVSFHGVSE